jgi:hypothetical protein
MPTADELRQTSIFAIPLGEASAKIRTGPPIDAEEDYDLAIWAGVLPLRQQALAPEDDPRLPSGVAAPDNVTGYRRSFA